MDSDNKIFYVVALIAVVGIVAMVLVVTRTSGVAAPTRSIVSSSPTAQKTTNSGGQAIAYGDASNCWCGWQPECHQEEQTWGWDEQGNPTNSTTVTVCGQNWVCTGGDSCATY